MYVGINDDFCFLYLFLCKSKHDTIWIPSRDLCAWRRLQMVDIKIVVEGSLSDWVSASGAGPDPGVSGSSPTSGSLHRACSSLCLCLCLSLPLSLSLCIYFLFIYVFIYFLKGDIWKPGFYCSPHKCHWFLGCLPVAALAWLPWLDTCSGPWSSDL